MLIYDRKIEKNNAELQIPGSFNSRTSTANRSTRRTRQKGWNWFPLRTKPVQSALELSRGGEFGRVGFPSVLQRLPISPSSSPPPKCEEQDDRMKKKNQTKLKPPDTPGTEDITRGVYNMIEGEGERKERLDESLYPGVKRGIRGRGSWGLGEGWKKEVGRGVWGASGREEWARVSGVGFWLSGWRSNGTDRGFPFGPHGA
jgi:hypothetical protein